eukprot:scaffold300_cov375-Prasinococcus_capsulatus_cf.AAC.4
MSFAELLLEVRRICEGCSSSYMDSLADKGSLVGLKIITNLACTMVAIHHNGSVKNGDDLDLVSYSSGLTRRSWTALPLAFVARFFSVDHENRSAPLDEAMPKLIRRRAKRQQVSRPYQEDTLRDLEFFVCSDEVFNELPAHLRLQLLLIEVPAFRSSSLAKDFLVSTLATIVAFHAPRKAVPPLNDTSELCNVLKRFWDPRQLDGSKAAMLAHVLASMIYSLEFFGQRTSLRYIFCRLLQVWNPTTTSSDHCLVSSVPSERKRIMCPYGVGLPNIRLCIGLLTNMYLCLVGHHEELCSSTMSSMP